MSGRLRGWMVPLLLLGTIAVAIAEEITLTTYSPSPRGVYQELRTAGNVQIGLLDPPAIGLPGPPRLHLVQGAGAAGDVVPAALRVDDEAPVGAILDASPFLIDASGRVGIGTPAPNTAFDMTGALSIRGMAAPPAVAPAGQGRIYFDAPSGQFRGSRSGIQGTVYFRGLCT